MFICDKQNACVRWRTAMFGDDDRAPACLKPSYWQFSHLDVGADG